MIGSQAVLTANTPEDEPGPLVTPANSCSTTAWWRQAGNSSSCPAARLLVQVADPADQQSGGDRLAFPRRERRVVFHSACGLREISGAMGAGLGIMPVLS